MLKHAHKLLRQAQSLTHVGKSHNNSLKRAAPETVSVPCAGNGSISLDVYAPLQTDENAKSSVAIFLPRGPICADEASDEANLALLQSHVSCHVVKINYRCSALHQYPTPVHDVAIGYDWIVSNLLPRRAIVRRGHSENVGKLAICGELVGGSLATMLALTECRLHEPGIVAAAINNAITDWVSLDENGTSLQNAMSPSASNGLTMDTLVKQRSVLFRKTMHQHDPFASPVLFFRTSGREVGEDEESPPPDELDELALLSREDYRREHQPEQASPALAKSEALAAVDALQTKKRRSSRRPRKYPSLGLKLPSFSITVGIESPILEQANEIEQLLQRSFARQNKLKSSAEAETDMVQMFPGLGLWDQSEAGRARMLDVARRLSESLRR